MNRSLLRCLLAASATLLAACSSFDTHWRDAARGKNKATRWDGHWTSEKHHKSDGSPMGGRLRCVLAPQANRSLTANFHANWLIFSGNYDVLLQPVPGGPHRGDAREYRGTHDLPAAFGGTYHYDATIGRDRFTTRYISSYDHGTFTLQRVPAVKESSDLHAQH